MPAAPTAPEHRRDRRRLLGAAPSTPQRLDARARSASLSPSRSRAWSILIESRTEAPDSCFDVFCTRTGTHFARNAIGRTRQQHSSFRIVASYIKATPRTTRDRRLVEQLNLFAGTSPAPEGLRYAADFVSPAIERELITRIAALPLQAFQFGQYEGSKRRVASFGFRYDYTLRRYRGGRSRSGMASLAHRRGRGVIRRWATRIRADACTECDHYRGRHRLASRQATFRSDIWFVAGVRCRFRFRRRAGEEMATLHAAGRAASIYMMSGPARQTWEHSVP